MLAFSPSANAFDYALTGTHMYCLESRHKLLLWRHSFSVFKSGRLKAGRDLAEYIFNNSPG